MMLRPAWRHRIPFLLCCIPLVSLSAQRAPKNRAFEPGGPETMVLAGSAAHTRPEVQEVVTGFSITTDRSGRVVGSGGDKKKETVDVKVYDVELFVDSTGVTEALRPFAGEDFYKMHEQGKLRDAVRQGAFPKLLVLRFSQPQKARGVRENLAEELRKYPGGSGGEAGRFTGYLRKDFNAGDEVEIRIAPGGTVKTTVKGEAQQEIASPEFADAILSVWLMKHRYMVIYLGPFMPPKPGS